MYDVGIEVLTMAVKIYTAREICLPRVFTLVSCFVYSSILKMKGACSSEMSVVFKRTTLRYVIEDIILHKITNTSSILYRIS
jgi:hypothetical protein